MVELGRTKAFGSALSVATFFVSYPHLYSSHNNKNINKKTKMLNKEHQRKRIRKTKYDDGPRNGMELNGMGWRRIVDGYRCGLSPNDFTWGSLSD